VLRQPDARRFGAEELNTATLILQTKTAEYENVVSGLRAELRLYSPEDEPAFETVRLKTRKDPLDPVAVKRSAKKFSLSRRALLAPKMMKVENELKTAAARPWPDEALEAPGTGRKATVSLEDGRDKHEYVDVLRSARSQNGTYLRNRLQQRNRACVNAIHPDLFHGEAFEQLSCHGSQAQEDLTTLAARIVDFFEERVDFQEDPDPEKATWKVGEYRPRSKEMYEFDRGAHKEYSKSDFNNDEIDFALAIDRVAGVLWARNPTSAAQGYGIPLPKKVGDSATFYPDFLIWKKGECWAVDTTGRHLLDEKVRGKLITIGTPKVALVVRGNVDLGSGSREGKDGWSLVLGRPNLKPRVEHTDDLGPLVNLLLEGG
jgi:type III restriction enzyme